MTRILLIAVTVALFSLNAFCEEEEAELEIGPDKGVTELASDKSFKLSPEAKQTFGIQTTPQTSGTFTLPNKAIAHARTESQIFRVRDGFFKPVHFKFVKKTEQTTTIQTTDLKPGDEVVTQGVGFLRIIAAQIGEKEEEKEEVLPKKSATSAEKENGHD